jgi:hypothetical protein
MNGKSYLRHINHTITMNQTINATTKKKENTRYVMGGGFPGIHRQSGALVEGVEETSNTTST